MDKKRIVMAVDGGATKTTLVIYCEQGKRIFEKTSTGTNYHAIGSCQVERVITDLLLDAYQAAPYDNIEIAGFAMAGLDTEHDLVIVKEIIEHSFNNVPYHINTIIVENDVLSTLKGITDGKPGALLLSGTGSIAYAIDGKGQIVRTGGWGHRAADEGSGYWIGQQIIRAVVRHEDGRSSNQTILKNLLYENLKVTQLDEMLAWLYHEDYTNAKVASISSILNEAVKLGDEIAIDIASRAAYELTILAEAILQKVNYYNEPFTYYLNGGILQNHSTIRDLFIQNLLKNYPNLSFKLCDDQPIQYILNRVFLELNQKKNCSQN